LRLAAVLAVSWATCKRLKNVAKLSLAALRVAVVDTPGNPTGVLIALLLGLEKAHLTSAKKALADQVGSVCLIALLPLPSPCSPPLYTACVVSLRSCFLGLFPFITTASPIRPALCAFGSLSWRLSGESCLRRRLTPLRFQFLATHHATARSTSELFRRKMVYEISLLLLLKTALMTPVCL
jgi:hypothetical protein